MSAVLDELYHQQMLLEAELSKTNKNIQAELERLNKLRAAHIARMKPQPTNAISSN